MDKIKFLKDTKQHLKLNNLLNLFPKLNFKFKLSKRNTYLIIGFLLLICIYFYVKNKKKSDKLPEEKIVELSKESFDSLGINTVDEDTNTRDGFDKVESLDSAESLENTKVESVEQQKVKIEYRTRPGFVSIPNQVLQNIQDQNKEYFTKLKNDENKILSLESKLDNEINNKINLESLINDKDNTVYLLEQKINSLEQEKLQYEQQNIFEHQEENSEENNSEEFKESALENVQNYINSISEDYINSFSEEEEDDRFRQQDLTATEIQNIQSQLNSIIN